MKSFSDRIDFLREACPRCFSEEIADFFPKEEHIKLAAQFLKERGNPECICNGEAKRRFRLWEEPFFVNAAS